MNHIRQYIFILLLLTASLLPVYSQDTAGQSTEKNILFIGNSYTYVFNLPHVVAAMAESRGLTFTVKKETSGGVTLEDHWKGEKGLKSVEKISEGDFDFVILQDNSMRPIQDPEKTKEYGALLCDLIKKSGAVPMFYLTWAREKVPQMQKTLNEVYVETAQENKAKVAPVGMAWQMARRLRPGIALFADDGSHPSPLGTYLTACVFFAVLSGEDPMGLPSTIRITDCFDESLILLSIDQLDAQFCQRVAADTVNNFGTSK